MFQYELTTEYEFFRLCNNQMYNYFSNFKSVDYGTVWTIISLNFVIKRMASFCRDPCLSIHKLDFRNLKN